MNENEVLLKLRRSFSGKEKYRLLLKHLDSLELQLAAERKLNTELMKKQQELKDLLNQRSVALKEAGKQSEKLKALQAGCVSIETHQKKIVELNNVKKQYRRAVEQIIQKNLLIEKLQNKEGPVS
jgi:hypothetical protein